MASGGEATSSRQRRETGTGMLESWAGQKEAGTSGDQEVLLGKHHLPSDRHTLKDLKSTGWVASSAHPEKDTVSQKHTAVHTDTSSEAL